MSYHIQSGFSAGELDPALHERTGFDKYQTGLATLRNALVGKTGRLVSRAGTKFAIETKYANKKCILFAPPYSDYLIEWGGGYVRIHDTAQGFPSYTEDTQPTNQGDLANVQFVPSGKYVYVFCEGYKMMKMVIGTLDPFDPLLDTRFLADAEMFYVYPLPANMGASSVGAPTGYICEYVATYVLNGQESLYSVAQNKNLPVAAGQSNLFSFGSDDSLGVPTEFRLYRRPSGGSAYGYVTSSNIITHVGAYYVGEFIDIGSGADYSHSPPTIEVDDLINRNPRAGTVYQQRLIITDADNEEAVYASRTGYPNNFTRDYPLGADSALTFKAGTSGNAKVLRFLDNNGLTVFTTVGMYVNQGPLSPENLSLEKKGNWVIDNTVPPLEIPGGIIFMDQSTNTVRTLIYSNEAGGYPGEEISIFSNHLFTDKRVKSWTFQEGDLPSVWVVMDDGSVNTLTYQREQQMQGWSHQDTQGGLFEACTTVKTLNGVSTTYFVVKRGNKRFIEYLTPRHVRDLKQYVGMDSTISFQNILSLPFVTMKFNITPLDILHWEGQLYLDANFSFFADLPNGGAAGTIYRIFDTQQSAIDLEVVTFVSGTRLIVQPVGEFPSDQGKGVTVYLPYSTLTGLDHLEGQTVSVMVDGYVIGSPNNDLENYAELTVSGGSITLPDGLLGAFVHVGLPFTVDIETLDIDTVEQKPTLLESRIVNRLYLKVYNNRGLFVGSHLLENDSVFNMVDPEERTEDIDLGNIGNAAQVPYTKRLEFAIPNDWKSNGRICIRQVDPLPMEILSIIPDMTVLY